MTAPFFTLGGAETQAFLLAQHLHGRPDVEVTVGAFLMKDGKLRDRLEAAGIRWRLFELDPGILGRRWQRWGVLLRLGMEIRKEGYDVILPFTYYPNVVLNLLAPITGARCVWNQRGIEYFLPVSRLERLAQRGVSAYVSNSLAGRDYLGQRLGVAPERVQVIRNGYMEGIPLEDRATWRQRIGAGASTTVFTMVANFFREKDHPTVLRALHLLLQRRPDADVRLVCVGGSPTPLGVAAAKALALDLGLQGQAVFLPGTADVAGLLTATDVGVLSSQSEGCPNSVLEYMLASLPVLATDIPGIREVFGEGNPHLFQVEDAETCALHMEALLDAGLRKALGGQNRASVLEQYAPERMFAAYDRLIGSLT